MNAAFMTSRRQGAVFEFREIGQGPSGEALNSRPCGFLQQTDAFSRDKQVKRQGILDKVLCQGTLDVTDAKECQSGGPKP